MNKKFTKMMAALALLVFMTPSLAGWGQTKDDPTVLFLETFGSTSSNTAYPSYSDYSAQTTMFTDGLAVNTHYTGEGKVGKSTVNPSTTYTGASGNSGAWHTGAASTTVNMLVIDKIKITGYTSIQLSFGAFMTNGATSSNSLTVKYKIDDGTEQTMTLSNIPSSSNTWSLATGSVSGTGTNLKLTFIHATTGGYTYRLDDIIVTGTAVPTSSLATPTFAPDGGVYSSTQSVVISSTDDDVDIYYTIDGTDPSESSTATEYTEPVQISDHTTLKAVATADYEEYSAIATAEYKFLPTLDVVVPADAPTYVYDNNGQSYSWYVLSGATTHGTTITEKGFVYSTTNNSPTTADTKIVVTSNDLEATLTGLAASTSYYVRSYAISEGQTVYSATATLTTPEFPTYDILFVVNGESYGDVVSVSGAIGEVINTQPTADLIPEGYTFAGWSSEEETLNIIDGTYAPSDDMFLYAVFSITEYGEPVTNYQKMTATTDDWSGEYLLVCENFSKVFNGTAGSNWGYCSDVTITNNTITSNETINEYVVEINKVTNGYTLQVKAGTYMDWEGDKHFSLGETAKTYSIEYYSSTDKSVKIKDGSYWLQYNGNIRSYSSNQTKLQLYKKTTTIPTVTKQYTRIMDVTSATATMANIPVTYKVIVKNNGILTLTGNNNGTAANLIIEDGGQLYTDDVVEATIKKNISAYDPTLTGVGVSNRWYFISYPLNCDYQGDAPTGVANMIANPATNYDLYKLIDNKWANYKHDANNENIDPEFTLYTGHGYLYANANNVTLEFAGSLNFREPDPDDDFISLDNTGWNLVGNPFAYNTYPSMSYYMMNSDGTGVAATEYTTADPVAPCTGILVNSDEGLITFSKNAPTTGGGAKGGINLGLAKNERGAAQMDNAIVSFNEGGQLAKFYFGSQNANLYIPQGTEEYAIVNAEAQGEIPVNFRANENGQYTLTVNPENVEMNYLHLIDNMTGMDIDLLQTPSYTFEANVNDYESRFRLVFAGNNEDGASTGSASFAFFSNGSWIINNAGEATLQVIDITGRILSSESVNGSVSTTLNTTPGVYMLRLINGDNVKVQKIVVR